MKRNVLLVLVLCVVLMLCACKQEDTVSTALGEFTYKQVFTSSLGDDVVAESGNTLLVIYLTPTDGSDVDDAAKDFFYSGTKAKIDGASYDMSYLAYEKVNDSYMRYVLVFEVADNGYETASEPPVVELILPSALPETSDTQASAETSAQTSASAEVSVSAEASATATPVETTTTE